MAKGELRRYNPESEAGRDTQISRSETLLSEPRQKHDVFGAARSTMLKALPIKDGEG
jgi:hypothetical protein